MQISSSISSSYIEVGKVSKFEMNVEKKNTWETWLNLQTATSNVCTRHRTLNISVSKYDDNISKEKASLKGYFLYSKGKYQADSCEVLTTSRLKQL